MAAMEERLSKYRKAWETFEEHLPRAKIDSKPGQFHFLWWSSLNALRVSDRSYDPLLNFSRKMDEITKRKTEPEKKIAVPIKKRKL